MFSRTNLQLHLGIINRLKARSMGNTWANLLRDEVFSGATAITDENHIYVKWNQLKKVGQYKVEVWCNQARAEADTVSKTCYIIPREPGRRYHFIIKPEVSGGGETQDQRCVTSNAVYTVPSQVTGICITESNGLKVEWRQPVGEAAKFIIRVKDSTNHIVDEVRAVASASYEREYKKLSPGMIYRFEISSKNYSKESTAATESYQYEGCLNVSYWIYLKKDCVCVLHAVTGIDVSDKTRKLENNGYKQLELMPKTYSLTRAELEARTAIDSVLGAKITPDENMITHDKLWRDGSCTEEYLLNGKKGQEYTFAYIISCQKKSTVKTPFRWICREQPRSMPTPNLQQRRKNIYLRRRTVDSGFIDTTDDPQQDNDFSDTDDIILEPRNEPIQPNGSGRSTNLKDPPAIAGAAANTSQPTPNQVQNDAQTPSAQSENPVQVRNTFMHIEKAKVVAVQDSNVNVGGKHETNHTPLQYQDTAKTALMRSDYTRQILPSRGTEDLSHLGACGSGATPATFHREIETGLNPAQLKELQKNAAQVQDTKESDPLLSS